MVVRIDGAALRRAREARGLSRAELLRHVEAAGYQLALSTLCNVERGRTPAPSLAVVVGLCRVLGLSVDSVVVVAA